jgi:pentatricopeptide repeat protein
VLSRLRDVSRVNAPESDMRPVLPGRDALMEALAEPADPAYSVRKVRRSREAVERHAFVSNLAHRAEEAAAVGDIDAVGRVFDDAVAAPIPGDRDIALRVSVMSSLHSATQILPARIADIAVSGGTYAANAIVAAAFAASDDVAEGIMSCLSSSGILADMRKKDVGIVLDVMVRGKLARGDTSGAFRIEQVSRVLEVGLRRGTYTRLIRTAGLDSSRTSLALALGAFHRALVVGRTPNAAMFNTVLEACFRAGDGVRARAVLAEMSREGVSMNGTTLSVLLIHTKDIGNVDAVFKLLQSQISGGRLKATPGMALSFVNAYIAAASVNSARLAADGQESVAYVERCFTLIDWFYRSGVGVTASTLDTLVTHLGECGNAEGALHAWREMRRGWLGSPSKRGRRALIGAVGVSDVPSRLDVVVWPKLVPYMSDRERQRLWRMQVGLDNRHDNEIMCANSTWHDARDQAAVLHRWVRQGRGYVTQALSTHGFCSLCLEGVRRCVERLIFSYGRTSLLTKRRALVIEPQFSSMSSSS